MFSFALLYNNLLYNKFVEEMSCPAGPPPDYETVVKQREEEENGLPTYSVVSLYPLTTEYIFYCNRAILFLSSSKILTPHPPLRPASLSSPRNIGGRYTLAWRRGGGGGSIFW